MAMGRPRVSLAAAAAALAGAVGACVLLGYTFGLSALVSLAPGLPAMAVPTAVGLLVLAAAVASESVGWVAAASGLAWISVGVGAGSGVLHAVFGHDVLGPLLARQIFGFTGRQVGQTSLATAACLILVAASVLLRKRQALAGSCATACLLLAGTALLGFAYGLHDLRAFGALDTMALPTAFSLSMLAAAALFARPGQGLPRLLASNGAAGMALRRQIAWVVLVPVAVGAVLARNQDLIGIGTTGSLAVLTTLTVTTLAVLAVRDGAARATGDAAREALIATLGQQAEQRGVALASSRAHYKAFFNASPQFLVLMRLTDTGELRYEDINPTVEAAYDVSKADVVGRLPSEIVGGETAASIESHARTCLRTRAMLEYDSVLITKSGARTPLRVVCAPVDLGEGRPVFVVFSGRDVSRQHDAEEALRALRESMAAPQGPAQELSG